MCIKEDLCLLSCTTREDLCVYVSIYTYTYIYIDMYTYVYSTYRRLVYAWTCIYNTSRTTCMHVRPPLHAIPYTAYKYVICPCNLHCRTSCMHVVTIVQRLHTSSVGNGERWGAYDGAGSNIRSLLQTSPDFVGL